MYTTEISKHNSNLPPCLSEQFHLLTNCLTNLILITFPWEWYHDAAETGMEIQVFGDENSSQTNAYSHYSNNYSYSGLIPNERALKQIESNNIVTYFDNSIYLFL